MDPLRKHANDPPGLAPRDVNRKNENRRRLRLAERVLTLIALILFGIWGGASLERHIHGSLTEREFMKRLSGENPEQSPTERFVARRARHDAASGMALGRIEIPRLGISAMIAEGEDAVTLWQGVGHLPGSAFPGERGNVALAGHRDTFFRKLRDITPKDQIIVSTRDGVFRYRVESARVVGPEQTSVLNNDGTAALTLVTCYPFSWVGRAPDRYVVRAIHEDAPAGLHRPESGGAITAAAANGSPRAVGEAKASLGGMEAVGAGRKD